MGRVRRADAVHALLVAPDAVRPPGAFDGLRKHMDHSPAQAVYFSALSVSDTGGELLPAGAAKFTGKDEQEVRALPPHGKGGKIYRRCRAVEGGEPRRADSGP